MSSTTTERLQEALQAGAQRRPASAGDAHPFLKWPEEGPVHVEGCVNEVWTGEHGDVVTMHVADCSGGVVAVSGSGEDQVETVVEPGATVNIGFDLVQLRDRITRQHVGKSFLVAFTGWQQLKGGKAMRLFEVFDLLPDDPRQLATELESEQDELNF
jgi:hypothetical protein